MTDKEITGIIQTTDLITGQIKGVFNPTAFNDSICPEDVATMCDPGTSAFASRADHTHQGVSGILRGLAINKPAPDSAAVGRLYIETDSPYKVWRDNGAGWDWIGYSANMLPEMRNSAVFLAQNPTSTTAGIQEAIDDLPATGGTVFIPPGVSTISVPIYIKSNVVIIGSGTGGTTITLANNSDCQVFRAGSSSGNPYTQVSPGQNVAIRGLSIDGNQANQNTVANRGLAGTLLEYVDGVLVEDVRVDDTGQNACCIFECAHAIVTESHFSGVLGKGAPFEDINGLSFENNDALHPASFPSALGHRISNCVFTENAGCGFSMWGGRSCAIVNCVSRENGGGFLLEDEVDPNRENLDCIMSNCVDANNTSLSWHSFQISPLSKRCAISNCISTNASGDGILVQGDDSIVTGNTVRDWGRGDGAVASYGISLSATDKVIVTGNQLIYETQHVDRGAFPIFVWYSNDFRIVGNLVVGSEDGSGIYIDNSTRGIISGNEIRSAATNGIHLRGEGAWGNIVLANNLLSANGQDGTGHGIWIQHACNNVILSSNEALGNNGFGIAISAVAAEDVIILGNICLTNVVGQISNASTGNTEVAHNITV